MSTFAILISKCKERGSLEHVNFHTRSNYNALTLCSSYHIKTNIVGVFFHGHEKKHFKILKPQHVRNYPAVIVIISFKTIRQRIFENDLNLNNYFQNATYYKNSSAISTYERITSYCRIKPMA